MPELLTDPIPRYSPERRIAELLEILIHLQLEAPGPYGPALKAMVRLRLKESRDNARPYPNP